MLSHKNCAVEELELELHHYHNFQLPAFLQLATSTGKSPNIRSLKITWSSIDVMANYLAKVMEETHTIDNVNLSEDLTRKPVKLVSAATWAALQSGCNGMRTIQQLSFLNARVTGVVNHVLQHIPTTIAHLNFTGCALNLMCAGQIASYLHGNSAIRSLDLSNTRLNSSEFVAIFQGMQMCTGIRRVNVRGVRLDRPCIVALVEYIKLTHSLEELDLSECQLNTEMCVRLVSAIKQNRTLTKLVFENAQITNEGRRIISSSKTKLKPVLVEGLLKIY